jgi:hypothetical protein
MDRKSRQWKRLAEVVRKQSKAAGEPCWICRQPIEWDAPPRSPKSFSADHLEPIARGGQVIPALSGVAPAHYGCNSRRGDGTRIRNAGRAWGW